MEIRNRQSDIVAKKAPGGIIKNNDPLMHRYTSYIKWKDDETIEEIDVDAVNEKYARICTRQILNCMYESGARIQKCFQRYGLYM